MNKTMIKTMLMFALAILGGAAWAAELVIPYSFDGKTGNTEYAYEYQVKMPSEALTSFTTTIRYTGGNHRVEILSVKLLDGETEYTAVATGTEGTEIVEEGVSYSGGNNYHNIFTFTNDAGFTANKVYTLQANLKVTNANPSHRGNIKVSGGITLYVPPYSFGVNFTVGGDDISTTEGAGFSKGAYAKPINWGNFTGSASGNGTMTVENQTLKVYWTSRGTYNSGTDKSTDDSKLLYGYLDDAVNGGRTKATVTITGLPSDKQYAVALILSGDGANNTDFNGVYSPALINGQTYSYVDGALVSGDAAKADNAKKWGDRSTTAAAAGLAEGTNVMFVEGLSGSILTITSAMDAQNTSRLTIAGVQVWTTEDAPVAPAAPTDKEVVSLNFYSSEGSVSGEAGLVAAQGWENLDANGTETILAVWNGETTTDLPLTLAYSSENGYQYTDGVTDNYIKGYLDDGGNQAQVTVENIPFEEYSVIVYAATDTENKKFKPILINGTYYAGADFPTAHGYANVVLDVVKDKCSWGGSRNATAVYGKNALRVDGLTASTLTIKGGTNSDGARGCIAALQIVNTGVGVRVIDLTSNENPKTSELGDLAGTSVVLKLSPGAVLNFDAGFSCESLEIYSEGAVTVGSEADIAFNPKLIVNADISISSETLRFDNVEIRSGKSLVVSNKNVVGANLSNAGVLKYASDLTSLDDVIIANKTGFANLTCSHQTVNFPGTLVIAEGDKVSFNGTGPQRLSMPIEMSGGELNLSSGNNAFWLGVNGCQINQSGGVVKMLGANTQMSGNGAGLLLGWMGVGPTYNLSGGLFDVQLSHINLWNTTRINISGGELKTLGFIACNGVKDSVLSLSGNGKLSLLGEQGVSDVLSVFNLNGGELSAKETTSIDTPVAIAAENAVVSVDESKELMVSGSVSGEGGFAKTGSGVLAFTGSLSEYSGTIILREGKITMSADSGFAGEVVADDKNKTVAKTIEDGVCVYRLSNVGFYIRVR